MADILLIMPKTGIFADETKTISWKTAPLGLLYIAGMLKSSEYEVKILDARVESNFEMLFKKELDKKPLFVGFHAHIGNSVKSLCQLSMFAKNYAPEIPVVYGGVFPSLNPSQILQKNYVDLVVVGEGEVTACELAKARRTKKDISRIAGIAYKKNGNVQITPPRPYVDLNTLPLIPWELIKDNRQSYFELLSVNDKVPFWGISMMTSRGCPRKCSFCYNTTSFNREFRAMSSRRVAEEVENLFKNFGVRNINFIDDNFLADKKRIIGIFDTLSKRGLGIKFRCDARVDDIDEDTVAFLAKNGLKSFFIGVESGSNRILTKVRKRISLDDIYKAANITHRYGISNNYSFVIGYPYSNSYDLKHTIKLACNLNKKDRCAFFDISIYTPVYGTSECRELDTKYKFYPQDLEACADYHWQSTTSKPWLEDRHFYKNLTNALYLYLNPLYRVLKLFDFSYFWFYVVGIFTWLLKKIIGIRTRMKFFIFLWEVSFFKNLIKKSLKFWMGKRKILRDSLFDR